MQTRFAIAVLVLGLLEIALLVLIALTPAPMNVAGLAHPEFAGMAIGGDGAARFEPIASYAFFFQILVLMQCYCLIAMGVSSHRHSTGFLGWLSLCLLLALFVWWRIMASYQDFLDTGTTNYFAGFPVATAWQVYAIWIAGMALVVLYVAGFRRYIWSHEDEAAFEALVAESKNKNTA